MDRPVRSCRKRKIEDIPPVPPPPSKAPFIGPKLPPMTTTGHLIMKNYPSSEQVTHKIKITEMERREVGSTQELEAALNCNPIRLQEKGYSMYKWKGKKEDLLITPEVNLLNEPMDKLANEYEGGSGGKGVKFYEMVKLGKHLFHYYELIDRPHQADYAQMSKKSLDSVYEVWADTKPEEERDDEYYMDRANRFVTFLENMKPLQRYAFPYCIISREDVVHVPRLNVPPLSKIRNPLPNFYKEKLLREVPGITCSWIYCGSGFACFFFHKEDYRGLSSVNFHHWGHPKIITILPASAYPKVMKILGEQLAEFKKNDPANYAILFGDRNPECVADHKSVYMTPQWFEENGIDHENVMLREGEGIQFASKACHIGFSTGLNVGSAQNTLDVTYYLSRNIEEVCKTPEQCLQPIDILPPGQWECLVKTAEKMLDETGDFTFKAMSTSRGIALEKSYMRLEGDAAIPELGHYMCDRCEKQFESRTEYYTHQRVVDCVRPHNKNDYACTVCLNLDDPKTLLFRSYREAVEHYDACHYGKEKPQPSAKTRGMSKLFVCDVAGCPDYLFGTWFPAKSLGRHKSRYHRQKYVEPAAASEQLDQEESNEHGEAE